MEWDCLHPRFSGLLLSVVAMRMKAECQGPWNLCPGRRADSSCFSQSESCQLLPVCPQQAHLFNMRGQGSTSLSFAQCLIHLVNRTVTHFRSLITPSSTPSSSLLHFFSHIASQPGTVPLWSFCMGDSGPQKPLFFACLCLFTHILS